MTELTIITPEKVALSFRLAPPSRRIGAHLIDLIIFGVIGFAVTLIGASMGKAGIALVLIYWSLGYFVFPAFLEFYWNGQTIGKFVNRLRVVMADGTPVTFPAALYRNLMRAADFLPAYFFLGITAMVLTERGQRLGDILANTVVISLRDVTRPVISPHKHGVHPLEVKLPPLRRMNIAEYRMLKQIADRAVELPPHVLSEKIEMVWPKFIERHQISMPEGIHPIYMIEATVMRYGRERNMM